MRAVDAHRRHMDRAKLRSAVEREIRSNDLDAAQSYEVLRRARWRAAFARLPHVAMSHHRRAAFFVLS